MIRKTCKAYAEAATTAPSNRRNAQAGLEAATPTASRTLALTGVNEDLTFHSESKPERNVKISLTIKRGGALLNFR